jgi:hypothetical protein
MYDYQEHKISQRKHLKKRCEERFGIELTKSKRKEIENLIRSGKSVFIKRQFGDRIIRDVIYEYKILRIVYDEITKTMVTVLYIPRLELDRLIKDSKYIELMK